MDVMPIHLRYKNDVQFRTLVDTLYNQIQNAHYTPTEIREAAMFAQILYEERNLKPIIFETVRILNDHTRQD